MRIDIKILILFSAFIFLSCKGNVQVAKAKKATTEHAKPVIDKGIFPKPDGFINDYGHVFTKAQKNELSKIVYDYSRKITRQIVVITVDRINPYNDIHKYATDLGNTWGIGTAEKDNGLIIVLCKPCRKISIATGTGTEKILTDEICKEVIDKSIIPEFKKGDFYKGIKNGTIELIKQWK